MSATERVRELLDERGVGWWNQTDPEPQTVTMARLGEQLIEYHENVNGTMGYHVWNMCDLTPEQAIAATLGTRTLTAEQVMAIAGRHQPDYCSDTHACFDWQAIADELNATLGSCNCLNSERTNVPCLTHFWTHDGTLHVEATRMPTRIVVCEGGTCEFVPKRELDASETENAKLRELVRDAWGDGHPDRSCEGCDIRDECHDDVERMRKDGVLRFSRCLFEQRIEERMRELGIKVRGEGIED